MLRPSKYNHFQPWQNGYHIAFNAKTGAVALMTGDNIDRYKTIREKLEKGKADRLDEEERKLVDQLKYGNFLIDSDSDEIEHLKFAHNLHRYDRTGLGLTIAPTLNCNMGCHYCYEENKQGKMSREVIGNIVKAIEKQSPHLERLEISWYGGEPLLALDVIEEFTHRIEEKLTGKNIVYAASMISNGYLLTEDIAKKLRDLHIRLVQVTLDGPRRMHNQRRPLKNGQGSYDRILQNIKTASQYVGIGVRVNVDKEFNETVIAELLTELDESGLREKIGIYFGQLEPASEICANIAENCYNSNEFSQAEVKYYRMLMNNGFHVERIPVPLAVYCMAQSINAMLIDPDGDLYRCYNHAGDKEKSVGNIADEFNYQHPVFRDFFSYNPLEDDDCRDCSVLPICMGGCPARRVDRKLQGDDLCDTWKHNLTSMLDIIAITKQQERQNAADTAGETK